MYKFTNLNPNTYIFEFSNSVNNDEINEFKNDFSEILLKKEKFKFIIDFSNLVYFNSSFFYSINKLIDSNETILKEYLIASSTILSSKFKNLLTFFIRMRKQVAPNFISPNISSSINFFDNLS